MYINDPYFPLIYDKILYWSKKKNSIFLMKYNQHPYFASISAFNKSCTGRLSSQSSIVSRNFPLKRLPYNNNKSLHLMLRYMKQRIQEWTKKICGRQPLKNWSLWWD